MQKPVLFSGVQPSGNLTLGNYLGALKNWVALQKDYQCFFSIVDLHAITVRQDPKLLGERCYDLLALYLAVGIDVNRHCLFLQSQVAAHSQLAWILNCYSYMGELSRMTQFKDKAKKHEQNISVGLFAYPVLMAADILLYRAQLVPVGEDQKQHLEIARDLALRFNNLYGEIFVVPQGFFPEVGAKIKSLQEPLKKMSKSDSNLDATIFLFDSKEEIANKFKRAITDSGREISYDPVQKPGITNLLDILSAVTDTSIEKVVADLPAMGYGEFKLLVAGEVIKFLQPLIEKYRELRANRQYLDEVLAIGAKHAQKVAQATLGLVNQALGLV
jgi:tryptophanyl-tRNA synthetase